MAEKRNTVIKSTKQTAETVNWIKCSLPAKSINESYARTIISAFVSQLDPTVSELADLKTAVSEAVTNAIVHGYQNKPSKECIVYLSACYKTDGTVIVEIKDKGCGIKDIRQAMEPTFTTAAGDERSGMGFTVMSSFCDKIKVSSAEGKGTIVILEKRFSST